MYCSRCKEDGNECSVCGAPDRVGRWVDGRWFCGSCSPRMVEDDSAQWEGVYDLLVQRAEQELGLVLRVKPPLVIDDASTLAERRAEQGAPPGLCGLYLRDAHGNASIHVLSRLPASRGAAVLAHELAHAWQAENCPDDQGVRIREGFAEWVSWSLLDRWEDGDRERAVIEARTDEYGAGFRHFRRLAERSGVDYAIWYSKAARASIE
ncbi:MAG: hypothetical protein R3B81_09995 [bacterium]